MVAKAGMRFRPDHYSQNDDPQILSVEKWLTELADCKIGQWYEGIGFIDSNEKKTTASSIASKMIELIRDEFG